MIEISIIYDEYDEYAWYLRDQQNNGKLLTHVSVFINNSNVFVVNRSHVVVPWRKRRENTAKMLDYVE